MGFPDKFSKITWNLRAGVPVRNLSDQKQRDCQPQWRCTPNTTEISPDRLRNSCCYPCTLLGLLRPWWRSQQASSKHP